MKFKLLAALLAIFAFCIAAQAQDFGIRISKNTNLRSIASLQGRIVETAKAGSTLQVIGSQGKWFKISHSSGDVWMANWVSYTRVESAGQATAPVANIDNCCFVDRQCNTDQEWSDGYWAFQNKQCAAPVQSGQPAQQPASSAPASQTPAGVDNCCFVDRQCHSEQEWSDGYWAFQNGQCYVASGTQPVAATFAQHPGRGGPLAWSSYMSEGAKQLLANPTIDPFDNCCFIFGRECRSDDEWRHGAQQFRNHQCVHPQPLGRLPGIVGNDSPLGTAHFTKLVNTALDMIRRHAPEWLHYMSLSGARQFELLAADGRGGFHPWQWSIVHSLEGWMENDPNWTPNRHYLAGYAGGIMHEACHALEQRVGGHLEVWQEEAACVEAQLAVIKAVHPRSRDIGWLTDLVRNIQNPDYWWW